ETAFNLNALGEDVIPLCGALAAKEHGDARKALDLLRKAGELAERRNAPMVTADYVYLAQDDIERDKMKEYCEALPLQSKAVLLSIYQMQRHRKDQQIITGDVYNVYSEMTGFIPGLNKLTQRRVSELIRELDLSGMVNARVKSNGRYGRTKFIKLNVSLKDMYSYLETEDRISDLLSVHPTTINDRTTRFQGKKYHRIG
ncbi:MAG: Cdc6/Cdc18 family protein, partial [Promethearchaeota archaeon]